MSIKISIGKEEYFPQIKKIKYEGPKSNNPLSFKYYDSEKIIAGKPMKDHFRFATAYWHTFCGTGGDPFGPGTKIFPWDCTDNPIKNAKNRLDAAFEFFTKLGTNFYCFHDRDIAPEGKNLKESIINLELMVNLAKEKQEESGVKLLWGTANLFSNPIYMNGAATNPDFKVVAHAAAQVKSAIDATIELKGDNYVFWGGREGYATLLNTDMKREVDHLAAFLHMAVDHAKKIGFDGPFYIEPKPREPSTHQYDSDAAACLNFLREYGLMDHFKLNIETNHATLAGHTMEHELTVCANANMLGSIDANRGDELIGWDTDQFPADIYLTTQVMLVVLEMGGLTTGGLNFDAKRRRESHEPIDLIHAHIGGMDAFARGLKIAHTIRKDGRLEDFVKARYSTFDKDIGAKIEAGEVSFEDLEKFALKNGEPTVASGRQEMLENLVNEFL